MKLSTTAIGLVLAVAATPLIAQSYGTRMPQQPPAATPTPTPAPAPSAQSDQGGSKLQPSNHALKAIVDLQNTVKANDFANVPAKVAAAQAVAQTKVDKYLIGVLQRQAALAANDLAALAASAETLANSGYLDAAKMSDLYVDLGVHQFNAKQYAQAVASFQRAVTANPSNSQAVEFLGRAKLASGQSADAVGTLEQAIQARIAAGQQPTEEMYRAAVQAAYNAKSPSAVQLSQQWAAAYPSVDSWRNSIAIYRSMKRPDVEGTLDLLRLMRAANALTTPGDYALYSTSAADQGNYNEAQAVIDAGIAAGVVKPSDPLFRDIIAGLKAKPKATEADLATATKTAKDAMALLRIGDRYYGMGQYAKAADLYRQAMAKGVDKNLANLHIGMALARAGDKAGATAALSAVGGNYADIAKFWQMYLQKQA